MQGALTCTTLSMNSSVCRSISKTLSLSREWEQRVGSGNAWDHYLFTNTQQEDATPLALACQEGHDDLARTLIGHGAQVNHQTKVHHVYHSAPYQCIHGNSDHSTVLSDGDKACRFLTWTWLLYHNNWGEPEQAPRKLFSCAWIIFYYYHGTYVRHPRGALCMVYIVRDIFLTPT